MCALLSKIEAWTVLDKEEVKVDRASLSLVKLALIALGVKSEVAEELWQEAILNPYLSQVESETGKLMSHLQHRMKQCLDGDFANLKPYITCPGGLCPPPRIDWATRDNDLLWVTTVVAGAGACA